MTLIITIISKNKVVQVADCRITLKGKSEPHDKHAVKAVEVACADARFCIGYSGVGEIEGKRTDYWLVDEIRSIFASGHYSLRSLTWELAERAEKAIAHLTYKGVPVLRKSRAFWLVVAGFHNGETGPLSQPFMTKISNAKFHGPGVPLTVEQVFTISPYTLNPRLPADEFAGNVSGAVRAIMDKDKYAREARMSLKRAMRHLKKVDRGEKPRGQSTVDLLVSVVREASRHPRHGPLIGRDCLSVVMHPDSAFSEVYYHPEEASTKVIAPHLIAPGGEITGGALSRD